MICVGLACWFVWLYLALLGFIWLDLALIWLGLALIWLGLALIWLGLNSIAGGKFVKNANYENYEYYAKYQIKL